MPTDSPHGGAIGTRREAREQALLLLYEIEARDGDVDGVVASRPVALDDYTVDILRGVDERRETLDAAIAAAAPAWPLARMAATDRAILRLGAWELSQRPEIDTAVILNEAVELAKRYGTDDSGRFVNGVLAGLAPTLR